MNFDPNSNGGKNFWSTPVAAALGKLQTVTQPLYDTYQKVFPHAPLAKGFESIRTGQPLTFSPEEIEGYGMAIMGNLSPVKASIHPNLLNIAKKAETGAVDEMAAFTDYAAKVRNKTIKPNYQYEADVREMAARMGLNPNKPNAKLASDFANVLAEGDTLAKKNYFNKPITQPKGVPDIPNLFTKQITELRK